MHIETKSTYIVPAVMAGALGMYFLDPQRGKRRRTFLRDKFAHSSAGLFSAAGVVTRDTSNRAAGVVARSRSLMHSRTVDDDVLCARVRSRLGRVSSHPRAIHVEATGGRVTLTGETLPDEAKRVVSAVSSVAGVKGVENRLVAKTGEHTPALQGRSRRSGHGSVLQANWPPALRFFIGTLGSGCILAGIRRSDALGAALTAVGATALTRAATNIELSQLAGIGTSKGAIQVRKTIDLDVSPHEAFSFWQDMENFPRFMPGLQQVHRLDDRRSHWVAYGPANTTVEWFATITRCEPNRVLSWRSEPGSSVDNAGTVRFSPTDAGGTRIDVALAYTPPAGAFGHAVARLFGKDAKSSIEEGLLSFKSLIEEKQTVAHNTEVHQDELQPSP